MKALLNQSLQNIITGNYEKCDINLYLITSQHFMDCITKSWFQYIVCCFIHVSYIINLLCFLIILIIIYKEFINLLLKL
jgi:hypothetical protein